MKGNKFRTDTTVNGVSSEVFIIDNEYVTCSKVNNVWNCFKMEMPEADQVTAEAEKNPDKYIPIYIGERTYAGIKGICYKIENVNKYDIETCYAVEKQLGLPLYIKSETDNFYSVMEATKVYDGGATEADFKYPAEPQEMPTLGDACSVCNQLTGESKEACLANC